MTVPTVAASRCVGVVLVLAVAALHAGSATAEGSSDAASPDRTGSSATSRTACDSASGRVLQVGSGKEYATPSAAAVAVRSGDVVKIMAGDFRGDVATWTADRLTICGVGGRVRLFADGRSAQDKAIWVVAGSDITIDGVDFFDAKVPDQNGAGIRAQGGDLTVRNSGFFDNENGILGGDGAAVTIDRCEFARNGAEDGQSHNIYVGFARRLTVTSSYFHEARIGHNLKSRAKETRIENSYFMDGPKGTSSYLADFPSGGTVFLRGNLFHKGPNAENSTAISFGAEGVKWPVNTFEMLHNTVVMTLSGGYFIAARPTTQSVRLIANLFAGSGGPDLLTGGVSESKVLRKNNLMATADQFPGADNVIAPRFWPTASVQARMALTPDAVDPDYRADAPRPFAVRPIKPGPRLIGAIQSRPQ